MIGLDTNVLVRYLVEDDEGQATKAAALIESAVDNGDKLYVAHVVLCELAWVLSAAYRRSHADVARAIGAVLRTAQFVVQDPDLAFRALHRYETRGADFADYLIAERAAQAGCDKVATFDKKLLRERDFVRP